tara:strand:+ start:202 stop:375 length:174 start_codon:yes stop_codon:yes gene_type:complete
MGFFQNTPEMATCVLQLETQRQATQNADARNDNTIDNQIINHGAGGCTPNFVTGGCL